MIKRMKGTYDITDDIGYYQTIEKHIQKISKLFGYQEIRTPHFESRDLFHRSVGADSDIISKETYDFKDRGNRMNTLRPEGTAGVVRALIENKLYAQPTVPQKLYYYGSMFRYERPQKGRFREFRQFGAEAFGSAHPSLDAEVIAYAFTVLRALKIKDVNVHLNTLGDGQSQTAYKDALKAHFKPHITTLCQDCQTRYETNPLRILDCKVDQGHAAMKTAPKTTEHLTSEAQKHFEDVQAYLDAMNIPYTVDHNLVRGLDYYTHTVFEVKVSEQLLGAQNAICGGGRYNDLVASLDGPVTPAVGFAFGVERLVVALKANNTPVEAPYLHAYFIILGAKPRLKAMALLQRLRLGGLMCDMDYMEKAIKGQFKQTEHKQARFVMVLGDEEVDNETIEVKDQKLNDRFSVSFNDLYITLVDKLTTSTTDCHDCDHKGEK